MEKKYSPEHEIALMEAVHSALQKAFKILNNDINVRLLVHEPHRFSVPKTNPTLYVHPDVISPGSEWAKHLRGLINEHPMIDTHINLLDSVDGPCIVHRDFRPGNIIVNEGKIQGIIDWAGARASFVEEDFCPLEFGEWPVTDRSKKSVVIVLNYSNHTIIYVLPCRSSNLSTNLRIQQ